MGSRRKAWTPDFATFSAPWIFTDFISSIILLNNLFSPFFILLPIGLSIKDCRILYKDGEAY